MAIGKNLIWLGPADGANDNPHIIEGVALSAATLPGTVVEQVATGLQTNAAAATVAGQERLVADKNQWENRPITEAWTQNENMMAIMFRSGEVGNVLVAASNNITAKGVPLSLNGAGLLQIATVATDQVIAHSDEIVNVTANALVRVRFA